jgi:hypothetical protein
MTSFRTRAAICAAGAAVFAALTAGTAIAVADANDDAFTAALQKAGISSTDPAVLHDLGRLICRDLALGTAPDKIAQDFDPPGQGAVLVAAAKQAYCP